MFFLLPLVPDERAVRVFTMVLGQRIYAMLLGHLHLLTTFCLFGSAGCAAVRDEKMSILLERESMSLFWLPPLLSCEVLSTSCFPTGSSWQTWCSSHQSQARQHKLKVMPTGCHWVCESGRLFVFYQIAYLIGFWYSIHPLRNFVMGPFVSSVLKS